jgi:hypothetical protein
MHLPTPSPLPALHVVRRHAVVLDVDLARFCGVAVEQIRHSARDFPGEFAFALDAFDHIAPDEPAPEAPRHVFTAAGALAVVLRVTSALDPALALTRAFHAGRG